MDIYDNNIKDCLRTLIFSNNSNEIESIENRLDDINIDNKANLKKIKYPKKNVKERNKYKK